MELTKTACELKESANRTMELIKHKLGEEVIDDDNIDAETLEMMRDMFHMCDLAMKLTCEQADAIEEMNRKLDKLLETK
jgi:hypothetical protein